MNLQLENDINSYQDQLNKQLAFKTLEDSYRPQIANLKSINDKQQEEITRMKAEITDLKNEIQSLEALRRHNLEVIQDLEEQLQEAQHGGKQYNVFCIHHSTVPYSWLHGQRLLGTK